MEHRLMQVPLNYPPNLNCKFYQARLRDFSQRVVGEMAEATEALTYKTYEEYQEEIADVYHFLLELMILSEIPNNMIFFREGQDLPEVFLDIEAELEAQQYNEVSPTDEDIRAKAYDFVEKIMLAMNELKKKPWKANHDGRETNVKQYHTLIGDAHYDFLIICYLSGITAEDLYDSYMDKHDINEARIATLQ